MFADALDEELSQGDVFPAGSGAEGSFLVLSHGCDIDKHDAVLVATIEADASTESGLLGHIKSGRVWHALHLGPDVGGWVNLRRIRMIPRTSMLQELAQRTRSMTDNGRLIVATKVFQMLTRQKPAGDSSSGRASSES